MNTHDSARAADRSIFSIAAQNAGALTLSFEGHYRVGQEVGVAIDDEVYLYRVAPADIGEDEATTQAHVARGVLTALVNGGFQSFPRDRATLVGNSLTLMPGIGGSVSHDGVLPRADVAWARSLWSN